MSFFKDTITVDRPICNCQSNTQPSHSPFTNDQDHILLIRGMQAMDTWLKRLMLIWKLMSQTDIVNKWVILALPFPFSILFPHLIDGSHSWFDLNRSFPSLLPHPCNTPSLTLSLLLLLSLSPPPRGPGQEAELSQNKRTSKQTPHFRASAKQMNCVYFPKISGWDLGANRLSLSIQINSLFIWCNRNACCLLTFQLFPNKALLSKTRHHWYAPSIL